MVTNLKPNPFGTPNRRSARLESRTTTPKPSTFQHPPLGPRNFPPNPIPTYCNNPKTHTPTMLTSTSLLSNLPLELRYKIYSYLVPFHTNIVFKTNLITTYLTDHEKNNPSLLTLPNESRHAIARTNRQIHEEVTAFYFTNNKFSFYSLYNLHAFLSNLTPQSRRFIREIFVFWDFMKADEAFELLRECSGLKRLELFLLKRPGRTSIWEMDGLETFRKLRVGKVGLEIRFLKRCRGHEWGPWLNWRIDIVVGGVVVGDEEKEVKMGFGRRELEEFRRVLVEELEGEVGEEDVLMEMARKRRRALDFELGRGVLGRGVEVNEEEYEVLVEMARERRRKWERVNPVRF